ncbi:lycopene cyclase domain-containing protein [Glaciibacter flavus]|uniref:lycopene cyclase domain-containing protein n=1 Tax=Orlajensenia flava TaxID=2565934 RepID=UPI003AFF660C
MSYLVLDLVILAPVVAIAVIALVRRPRMLAPIGLTVLCTVILTAVFDNIMIANGIVAYDLAGRSGWGVGLAPVEDFAYPLAAALLLPSLWALVGGPSDEQAAYDASSLGTARSEEKADAAD